MEALLPSLKLIIDKSYIFWLSDDIMNNITTAKQELERLFNIAKNSPFEGFLFFANQYIGFIEKTPFLKETTIDDLGLGEMSDNEVLDNLVDLVDNLNNYESFFPLIYKSFKEEVKKYSTLKKDEEELRARFFFINSQITNKLAELELNQDLFTETGNPSFDNQNRLLHIQGEELININKQSKISNQFILLEYLFNQELGIEISFKEMRENAFETDEVNCIVTCRDLNEKINKETDGRISDFLIYKKSKNGFVKINPKYLSTF